MSSVANGPKIFADAESASTFSAKSWEICGAPPKFNQSSKMEPKPPFSKPSFSRTFTGMATGWAVATPAAARSPMAASLVKRIRISFSYPVVAR